MAVRCFVRLRGRKHLVDKVVVFRPYRTCSPAAACLVGLHGSTDGEPLELGVVMEHVERLVVLPGGSIVGVQEQDGWPTQAFCWVEWGSSTALVAHPFLANRVNTVGAPVLRGAAFSKRRAGGLVTRPEELYRRGFVPPADVPLGPLSWPLQKVVLTVKRKVLLGSRST